MCESIFLSFWGLWGKITHFTLQKVSKAERLTPGAVNSPRAVALAHGRQRQAWPGLGVSRESWPPAGVPPAGPAVSMPLGQGEGDLQPEPEESPQSRA